MSSASKPLWRIYGVSSLHLSCALRNSAFLMTPANPCHLTCVWGRVGVSPPPPRDQMQSDNVCILSMLSAQRVCGSCAHAALGASCPCEALGLDSGHHAHGRGAARRAAGGARRVLRPQAVQRAEAGAAKTHQVSGAGVAGPPQRKELCLSQNSGNNSSTSTAAVLLLHPDWKADKCSLFYYKPV